MQNRLICFSISYCNIALFWRHFKLILNNLCYRYTTGLPYSFFYFYGNKTPGTFKKEKTAML